MLYLSLSSMVVDGPVIMHIHSFLDCLFDCLTKFVGVIVMSPIFAIPGTMLGLLGSWIGDLYIRAQLSVKREMSRARAPVLGHVGSAIAGLGAFRLQHDTLTKPDCFLKFPSVHPCLWSSGYLHSRIL